MTMHGLYTAKSKLRGTTVVPSWSCKYHDLFEPSTYKNVYISGMTSHEMNNKSVDLRFSLSNILAPVISSQ